LGIEQRDQMLPALEALVIGVAVVALDDFLELPAVDRFEQLDKSAIRELHAPSFFLSLDNQKIDGKFPAGGACPCDFSIHPTSSPDSPARSGEGWRPASTFELHRRSQPPARKLSQSPTKYDSNFGNGG